MTTPPNPHATTPAAGSAPAAHSGIQRAERVAIIAAFNKFKKPLAKMVVQAIPDPLQEKAAIWTSMVVPIISGAAAMVLPDDIGEMEMDFFSEVSDNLIATVAARGAHAPAAASASTTQTSLPSVDEVKELARLGTATSSGTSVQIQVFFHWFGGLLPDQRSAFFRLSATLNDVDLANLVKLPPNTLTIQVNSVPATAQKVTPLNYIDLKIAVLTDPSLANLRTSIQTFIAKNPGISESLFWGAIQTRIGGLIKSMGDLKKLFTPGVFSDTEILRMLGLHITHHSVGQAISELATHVSNVASNVQGALKTRAVGTADQFGSQAHADDFAAKAAERLKKFKKK